MTVYDDKSYDPAKRDGLFAWYNIGSINMFKLLEDRKIELNDTPISEKWFKYDGKEYTNAIFTG